MENSICYIFNFINYYTKFLIMEKSDTIQKIEAQRTKAMNRIDREYYDRNSPHYLDNQRFSWAVKRINQGFNEKLEQLKNL